MMNRHFYLILFGIFSFNLLEVYLSHICIFNKKIYKTREKFVKDDINCTICTCLTYSSYTCESEFNCDYIYCKNAIDDELSCCQKFKCLGIY